MDKDTTAQSLYDLAEETRPDAAFAARLERDVLARWNVTETARNLQPDRRQAIFKRLALATMAAAVVLLVVWAWPLWPGNRDKADLPLLPRLAAASGGGETILDGLLSGVELLLGVQLPKSPDRAPVYNVTANVPATTGAALAWARDFGLPDPQVYRDPREPEALVVMGSDGRTLTFRPPGPMGGIHYGNSAAVDAPGSAPSFEQASEVAVAFLREHNLLPDHYRVTASELYPHQLMVDVMTELEGQSLIGDTVVINVVVNADGEVTYAQIPQLTFERLHGYPLLSAQEAWDELLAGGAFRLDSREARRAASEDRYFYRPVVVEEVVSVRGWVQILVPDRSDQAVWAQVTAQNSARYLLSDIPNAEALTRIGYNDVRVSGVVVENLGPNTWRLAVQAWEVATDTAPLRPLVGTLRREGDAVWLVDDNGARYPLPDPPAELDDGTRIEVFLSTDPAPGELLDWLVLNTPPAAERGAPVPGGASTVSVVVQPEEAGTGESPPTPEAPFTLGQTVEVTGVVHATLYREGDREWIEASLAQIPGVEYDYPLDGTDAMLKELAQLNRLHVRIQGQIVPATVGWTLYGQAIEVQSLVQLWPEERRYVFLGHVAQETIDGQAVAVLTECNSNERYILVGMDPDFVAYLTESERQVRIQGALNPVMTLSGLPVLRVDGMTYGGDIDRLPCAAPALLESGPEFVNLDDRPGRAMQIAFTVDRVELAYYYESQYFASPTAADSPSAVLVQPVWIFSGVSGDGLTRFTAYVQAAREKYIADTYPQIEGGVAPDRLIGGAVLEVNGDVLVIEDEKGTRVTLHINENTRIWKGRWDSPLPIEVGDFFYGYGDPNADGTVYEMEQLEVNIVNLRGEVISVTETLTGLDVELEDVHIGPVLVHIKPETEVVENGESVPFAESTFTLSPGDGLHLTDLRLKDGSVDVVQTFNQ